MTASTEHAIPGDYQLRALLQRWRLQRAWQRARLELITPVLPPAADEARPRRRQRLAASSPGSSSWPRRPE